MYLADVGFPIPVPVPPNMVDPLCAVTPQICIQQALEKMGVAAGVPGILQMIVNFFIDPLGGVVQAILSAMFSWLLIPSVDPEHSSVVSTIKDSWMGFIVVVFLTCGIIWQGLQMAISRRGAPAIRVVKAVLVTAAAGGIATVGSAALLRAGDTYSCWVIGQALHEPNTVRGGKCAPAGVLEAIVDSRVVNHFVHVLEWPTSFFPPGRLLSASIAMCIGMLIALSALIQMFLVMVRGASLLILVGVSQLAAAGTVTGATSGWPRRLVTWMLALIFYKPVVAMVYATALLLTDNGNEGLNTIVPSGADNSIRNFIFGVTMMLLAPFAMPALMKFFTWGFTALGRDGTMGPLGTGVDNMGDNAIRIANIMSQQKKDLPPQPLAIVDTRGLSMAGARGGGMAGATTGGGTGGAGPGSAAAAAGAGRAAGAAGFATRATVFAPPAAAAGAAAGPIGMAAVGVAAGSVAAATQIGQSLKKGITDHMDEDNK